MVPVVSTAVRWMSREEVRTRSEAEGKIKRSHLDWLKARIANGFVVAGH